MYKCKDCNKPFEEPATEPEIHGLRCGPFEQFSFCPFCGSDSYEEIDEIEEDDDE